MKKYVLIALLGIGLATSFGSCAKCSTCRDGAMDGQEICSKSKNERDVFEGECVLAGGHVNIIN
jgi:hypothetical protein